jgi:hypothetical protein
MKAFFHRLHLGGTKEKDQPKQFKQWPPPPPLPRSAPEPAAALPPFKPLPELAHPSFAAQLSPPRAPAALDSAPSSASSGPSSPPADPAASPNPAVLAPPDLEAPPSISRKATSGTASSTSNNGNADIPKKVAFISPPSTPGTAIFERDLPETPPVDRPPASPPLKSSVSRFQATHVDKARTPVAPPAASSSKVDLSTRTAIKSSSTRATSPYLQRDVLSAQSLRSPTPYSTMSGQTNPSKILAATSWSEVTEEDLVSNIGSRERTRQEVLFEIISSEDRYGTRCPPIWVIR